jgi:hypothetical protein
VQLARHGLDPDADERRQRAGREPFRDFFGRRLRVPIFLDVRSVAVAVFEIDAEVFNRLAAKFLHDTRSNRTGKFLWQAQRPCDGRGIGRVLVEHT